MQYTRSGNSLGKCLQSTESDSIFYKLMQRVQTTSYYE